MKKKPRVAKVSDHAVVRYLERVKGFDFDPVRKKIQKAAQAVLNTGASRINFEGLDLVMTDEGVVVTAKDRRSSQMRGKVPRTTVAID